MARPQDVHIRRFGVAVARHSRRASAQTGEHFYATVAQVSPLLVVRDGDAADDMQPAASSATYAPCLGDHVMCLYLNRETIIMFAVIV